MCNKIDVTLFDNLLDFPTPPTAFVEITNRVPTNSTLTSLSSSVCTQQNSRRPTKMVSKSRNLSGSTSHVTSTPLSSRVCTQQRIGRSKLVSKSRNLSTSTHEKSTAHVAVLERSRSPLDRLRSPPKKKKSCISQDGVREMSHSQSRSECSRYTVDEDWLSGIDIERLDAPLAAVADQVFSTCKTFESKRQVCRQLSNVRRK